jgi:hypothetical protein
LFNFPKPVHAFRNRILAQEGRPPERPGDRFIWSAGDGETGVNVCMEARGPPTNCVAGTMAQPAEAAALALIEFPFAPINFKLRRKRCPKPTVACSRPRPPSSRSQRPRNHLALGRRSARTQWLRNALPSPPTSPPCGSLGRSYVPLLARTRRRCRPRTA